MAWLAHQRGTGALTVERITLRQPIAEALDLLPTGIRRRVEHAHFLTGANPNFVGLHPHETTGDISGVVYRYDQVAHVTWLAHQSHLPASQRHTTVVLPTLYSQDIATIIHELGHVLHEAIDYPQQPIFAVSAYAETDWFEAFAEAFEVWLTPPHLAKPKQDRTVLLRDEQTLALFEELAR